MYVVATVGHVDHGKSTLVRALTGMEPDRWAEERRRGMTLDLGFAWTTLADGLTVAFVDVPGHEQFVATMLAGVGPVPGVMVVVSADGGWSEQTTEHVAILDALGVRHGVLVVTRSDLADPRPVLDHARERLARTSLGEVEACAVCAVTGAGLPELRGALLRLVRPFPQPPTDGRVRLFVDRSFTIQGSGTVVTGTLGRGRLEQGGRLELLPPGREVRIRGLQSMGEIYREVAAVARVAVNLRGAGVDEIHRGSVLVTPGAWIPTAEADVRLVAIDPADLPGDLMLHVGSAAVPCRVRPLAEDTARLLLSSPLPLEPGDRAVLRDPSRRVVTGLVVLDVDPPPLRRRGAARQRAHELAGMTGTPDPAREVRRRGHVERAQLIAMGVLAPDASAPAGVREIADYLVDADAWVTWRERLSDLVDAKHAATPLQAGLPLEAARRALGLPDLRLVEELIRDSKGRLVSHAGRVARPGAGPLFTEEVRLALDRIRERLDQDPLAAPEAQDLAAAGLTHGVIAAAARAGFFLRLPGDVLIHPEAPERAADIIARLRQPFTLSEARQALGTTRRVAVPLLEHLDAAGLTVRVDAALRRMRVGASSS